MERRWSRRKRVSQEVFLRYRGLGILRCKTLDISFEGACIETGPVEVPPPEEIELIFFQREDELARVVRISANVVRTFDTGIGVSFRDYHDGSHKFLLRLLG